MNAPTWLTDLVGMLMVFVAGYSVWRLVISRAWGRATDYESDILHVAVGIAAAGIVAGWAHTLPRSVWTAVFIAGAVYFAVRIYLTWSDRTARARLLAHTACCAVLVYMFLANVAPTTIHGSTAGMYTMAGMDGMILDQTITYPTIGLIFVVGLCFYAVATLNNIAPLKPEDAEGGSTLMLAPRSVDVCRIVIVLVLAYAILTKIV
ncbi:MAG TPA: DUF5134 domain-containing protein [Actinospica sp.]|jgi:hypothetical protein|nr:DUF5134 domain-containing protein [Actinospica sp.]